MDKNVLRLALCLDIWSFLSIETECWVSTGGSISGDPSIIAAVKFAMLVVQYNAIFNIMDHLTPLIRKEFSDSRTGINFTYGKTKTAAIANCIENHFFDEIPSPLLVLCWMGVTTHVCKRCIL